MMSKRGQLGLLTTTIVGPLGASRNRVAFFPHGFPTQPTSAASGGPPTEPAA